MSCAAAPGAATTARVLHHWFGAAAPRSYAPPPAERMRAWFVSTPEADAALAAAFGGDVAAALDGDAGGLRGAGLRGELAFVVLCDQMARNLFRGQARAFAGDAAALRVALRYFDDAEARAVAREGLSVWERVFLYMPLMHAEELAVVEKSVAVNEAALVECKEEAAKGNKEAEAAAVEFVKFVQFAEKHRKIVDQFGRYPHRNEALGRESTPEELKYLVDAERFGQ